MEQGRTVPYKTTTPTALYTKCTNTSKKSAIHPHLKNCHTFLGLLNPEKLTLLRIPGPDQLLYTIKAGDIIEYYYPKSCVYLNLLIDLFEHGRNDKLSLHSLDLLPCGPDVPEENLLPFVVQSFTMKPEAAREKQQKPVSAPTAQSAETS